MRPSVSGLFKGVSSSAPAMPRTAMSDVISNMRHRRRSAAMMGCLFRLCTVEPLMRGARGIPAAEGVGGMQFINSSCLHGWVPLTLLQDRMRVVKLLRLKVGQVSNSLGPIHVVDLSYCMCP